MKYINVLILEDDIETVEKLTAKLASLENALTGVEIDVTVFSNYLSLEKLVNPQEKDAYDIILLDRDCKLGGSFHILDIEKFGPEKIISISSTPQWNKEAQARGIEHVVFKDFTKLDNFAESVAQIVERIIKGMSK